MGCQTHLSNVGVDTSLGFKGVYSENKRVLLGLKVIDNVCVCVCFNFVFKHCDLAMISYFIECPLSTMLIHILATPSLAANPPSKLHRVLNL